MSMQRACAVADLADGTPLATAVDGVEIALVRVGEDVYAIRDECSHAAIALSEGEVDGRTIECWLHGSRFDLRTGSPLGLPATDPVDVYACEVVDGDVRVDVATPAG